MPLELDILALIGKTSSNSITETLSVFALGAFMLTSAIIVYFQLTEPSKKRLSGRAGAQSIFASPKPPPKDKTVSHSGSESARNRDLEKVERKLKEFLNDTLSSVADKMDELSRRAKCSFEDLAEAYAKNSYGMEGEVRQVRKDKFKTVCGRQWGHFYSELSFAQYSEVQRQLRSIFDTYKLLDPDRTIAEDESIDLSPELLRSQEIVNLVRAVTKDKVGKLQKEMFKLIEPFKTFFEHDIRDWLNERIVLLVTKVRETSDSGIKVVDTKYKNEILSMKTRLETISKLSEQLSQGVGVIDEPRIALSQVVYTGTVLSILSQMFQWCSELNVYLKKEE